MMNNVFICNCRENYNGVNLDVEENIFRKKKTGIL